MEDTLVDELDFCSCVKDSKQLTKLFARSPEHLSRVSGPLLNNDVPESVSAVASLGCVATRSADSVEELNIAQKHAHRVDLLDFINEAVHN